MAKNLEGVFLFNENSSGRVYNSVTQRLSSTNGPTWYPNFLRFDGNNDKIQTDIYGPGTNQQWTVFTIVKSHADADRKMFASGSASRQHQFTKETGFRWRHGNGNITYGTMSNDVWYSVAHVIPSGATKTDDCFGYINGVRQTASRTGGADQDLDFGANNTQYIGVAYGGAANYFDGDIALFYSFSRELTDSEIAQLHINPYCMFKPTIPVWMMQYVSGAASYIYQPRGLLMGVYGPRRIAV